MKKSDAGTKEKPWDLKTPPGSSDYQAYKDEAADPPALVVQVGKTQLRYHLRCIEDLHAMLTKNGDWVLLGSADEQKPAADGTIEAWGRASTNPVKGWYGLKKGLRGRFGMYVPPVLEALGLAEVEHNAKNNRMRAVAKKKDPEDPRLGEFRVTETPAALGDAREQFLSIVAGVRPELHRYCARLTGSVVEGEDIVQDTLAKAFYALSLSAEVPPLRPWLFRIAHNAAIDFMKSHGRKYLDVHAEIEEIAGFEDKPDPAIVRAALASFLSLPVTQRSAVILKDVLGHSLEEAAETMGTTVMAVKAALVRGRGKLLEANANADDEARIAAIARADLDRYATLFNARDWDGVRALVSDDCRLDLVSKSQRRGKQVGMYFGNYEKANVALRVVRLDGQFAFAAYVAGASEPAYFILLEFADGRVTSIRDFRYVPYITVDAVLESA